MAAKQENGSKGRKQLEKAIREDAERRVEECKAKIEKALGEDRCALRGMPRIDENGRIVADVGVVAI